MLLLTSCVTLDKKLKNTCKLLHLSKGSDNIFHTQLLNVFKMINYEHGTWHIESTQIQVIINNQ